LEREGGTGGYILACEKAGVILPEPTSLNGGKGLVMGSPCTIVGGIGASKSGGGVEKRWWRGGGEVVVDEQE